MLDDLILALAQRNEPFVLFGQRRYILLLFLTVLHRHFDAVILQNLSKLLIAGQTLAHVLFSLAFELAHER